MAMPTGWTSAKLDEVAKTATGGTPARNNRAHFAGTIPWVKSGELDDNIIYDTEEHLSSDALRDSSAKIFPKRTVLVALYGATVGKTAILETDAATNQAICAIFVDDRVLDHQYLRYFLMHLRPDLLGQRYGGAQPNISQAIIRNTRLHYPSISEQRQIAALLSAVQRAIERQERLITLTGELKKALMDKLFTEGTRGERLTLTEIGTLPHGWRIEPLGDHIMTAQYGLSVKGTEDGATPLLRMTNQVDGRIVADDIQKVNISEGDRVKFKVEPQDILFNRTNSFELVGRTAMFALEGDFVFASYLIRIRTQPHSLRPAFLNHYLNSSTVQARLKGIASRAVSQSNISASRLRTFLVALPSPEEQDDVVDCIDKVDRLRSVRQHQLGVLQGLFRTLLHHLMTAQIRVHELDRAGLEPAEAIGAE
jgi:type I restriction enzyme S subunit